MNGQRENNIELGYSIFLLVICGLMIFILYITRDVPDPILNLRVLLPAIGIAFIGCLIELLRVVRKLLKNWDCLNIKSYGFTKKGLALLMLLLRVPEFKFGIAVFMYCLLLIYVENIFYPLSLIFMIVVPILITTEEYKKTIIKKSIVLSVIFVTLVYYIFVSVLTVPLS